MKKKSIAWFLVVATVFVFFLSACGKTADMDPTDAAGEGFTGSVTIVHVNDIHGYVSETEEAIGFAKISGFFQQTKEENPNTIFLDAGDCFSGSAYTTIDQGESIVPILNTVGIDAMVAGNHDFNYGSAQLLRLASLVNYPILSANMVYRETQENLLDGYDIITLDNGMKVGVIGLTTPVAETMGASDVMYVDAISTCQALVTELKPQVDIIVALTHVGENEGDALTSTMIADQVEGLDVIIDGHSHTALPEGRWQNGVLIAQTGEYSHNVGVVNLIFENGTHVNTTAKLITKSEAESLPVNDETAALVAALEEKSDAFLAEIIGSTDVALVGTRDIIRTGETNIGSLFADVMREAAGADISCFNAGLIGGEIPVGDITRRDLTSICRVDSLVIVKEMTGADLLEYINYSLDAFPSSNGSFLQISGISYTIDPDLKEDKIFNVTVGGEPIDLAGVYTVATSLGVSSEPGMVNGTLIEEVGYTSTFMGEYIAANSPIHCETDGRISVGTKPAGE